jgi:hypothetical protein
MPKCAKDRPLTGSIIRNREKLLPLSDLAKQLPNSPEYTTLWKWVVHGKKHPHSKKWVRMEAIYGTVGLVSSLDAYWRFIDCLNGEG